MTRLFLGIAVLALNWDAVSAGEHRIHHGADTPTRPLSALINQRSSSEKSAFPDFFCIFGTGNGRMCHSDTIRSSRRVRISSNHDFGTDLPGLSELSDQRISRRRVSKTAILAKRSVKWKEVVPTASKLSITPDTRPRPAQMPAGADYGQLRYDVIKACWDDVNAFIRWREGR